MIGRLNHVAIAVPDLAAAADQYRNTLGAKPIFLGTIVIAPRKCRSLRKRSTKGLFILRATAIIGRVKETIVTAASHTP